jgi:aspartate carbamoyltransferase catalytic subunit
VARSNIKLLKLMGAQVRIIAPPTLMPAAPESFGVGVYYDMRKGLEGCDVIMMLRLQTERMESNFVPSIREYFHFWGLDDKKLAHAKPDAVIMHPGPINRGVELDTHLADDLNRSMILEQVEMGVAVRQAVLELLAGVTA